MNDQMRSDSVRPEADAIADMQALVEGARQQAPNLGERLAAVLDNGSSEAADLLGRAGQAVVSGQDFLFLLKTDRPASVSIDDQPPLPMTSIEGTGIGTASRRCASARRTIFCGTSGGASWAAWAGRCTAQSLATTPAATR